MSEKLPMPQLRELTLLLARVVIGATFLAHAYQKLVTNGMGATATGFAEMGIPLPTAAAWFAMLVEGLGGIALVLGALLPVAGVLLAAVMLGAWAIAHTGAGFYVTDGGFEYVLVLAVVSLALGFSSPRYALDTALLSGNRSRVAEPQQV
ncbi:DoxX family protein [Saccharopolyspora sp. HNM0983]|uniref:DoxX family protein n=1 Tax=Saccharopolyspora montiporae TaxID=2781240 RepID=A0A929BE55_9PSEU|nr:DoxX family protein [Saccharopolyspora sp. HNM0983]MBE9376378.1 DoxX family protein [Saccharopolyspora sp. HNM0983]